MTRSSFTIPIVVCAAAVTAFILTGCKYDYRYVYGPDGAVATDEVDGATGAAGGSGNSSAGVNNGTRNGAGGANNGAGGANNGAGGANNSAGNGIGGANNSAGSGAAGTTGGTSGFSGGSEGQSVVPCPGVTPAEPAGLSSTPDCSDQCGQPSHCVPVSEAGASGPTLVSQGDTCKSVGDSDGVCVPDAISYDSAGQFVASDCVSSMVGSGKCLPQCFVSSLYRTFLTSPACAPFEVCAPCVNPLTGTDTGACTNRCQ